MKELIVYAHLNPVSFTKAIVDQLESNAKERGDEVQIVDLYGDGFNPVLNMEDIAGMQGGAVPSDVAKYQAQITWADKITVVYPMWWGQMPAMLKGYIDRVFASGFAFLYGPEGPKGLLANKQVRVVVSTGTPDEYYAASGMHTAQNRVLKEGLFGFCGMETEVTFLGNVTMGTDELRKGYLASL